MHSEEEAQVRCQVIENFFLVAWEEEALHAIFLIHLGMAAFSVSLSQVDLGAEDDTVVTHVEGKQDGEDLPEGNAAEETLLVEHLELVGLDLLLGDGLLQTVSRHRVQELLVQIFRILKHVVPERLQEAFLDVEARVQLLPVQRILVLFTLHLFLLQLILILFFWREFSLLLFPQPHLVLGVSLAVD
jgi:hypothetical protein